MKNVVKTLNKRRLFLVKRCKYGVFYLYRHIISYYVAYRKGASVVCLDEKLCKGCVCKTCRKSEYNGAMFVCSANGCSVCNDNNIMRLQRCDSYEDVADCNADDLRL